MSSALRSAAYHRRQKNNTVVLPIEVNYYDLVDVLMALQLITERESLDRDAVNSALNNVIVDWLEGWKEVMGCAVSLPRQSRSAYADVIDDLDL